MSLNNLNTNRLAEEPFRLWKKKQKVHYRFDVWGKVDGGGGSADDDDDYNDHNHVKNSQISSDSSEYISIKAPKKSASYSKLQPPSTQRSISVPATQPVVRYVRSPCDSCGHHNIPIMSHPISPLARSQTNLELVETGNARQALLPVTNDMHRDESTVSLIVPQTLQISRRPSVLLQEILGGKKDHTGVLKNSKQNSHANGTATGSTLTINTPGGGGGGGENGPRSFQAKQQKEKNRRQGNDAISSALSATYCKLLVLLGVCLPITEVITQQIPTYVYQGFYVYLYSLSITFVVFLYVSAFRNRTLFNALKSYHERNNVHLKHKVTHFGSFYLRVGAIAFAIGTMVYSGLEFGQFFELSGQAGCRDIFIAITPICRMILCIAQVQFIFLNTTYLDMAQHKVFSRFGLMHMVGTNLCEWLYVLVEETKHEIFHIAHHEVHHDADHDAAIAAATNGGGVNWAAVNATLHVNHHLGEQAQNSTIAAVVAHVLNNVTATTTEMSMEADGHGCSRTTIMGALVQQLSPFLFPCTIEYSLICAVILYEMWKTVKSIPDIDKSRKNSIKPVHQKPAHHFSVDCSQSHKGLFFGILVIVMTIIAMIMYFVLYDQPGYELVATQEVTIWETVMYLVCSAAIVTGMILMRDLKYIKDTSDEHHSMDLDNLLLIVAQTGVYLYGMFSILGSYFAKWDTVPDRVEGIIAEVFALMQTSLQTMFILHSSHRRCKGATQVRRKPGRTIITFLLVANISIWFVNTLIKGRAVFRQSHMEFFGVWAWTIITHVSMPLSIFYRFHSTICLFEVWKITYKAKAH